MAYTDEALGATHDNTGCSSYYDVNLQENVFDGNDGTVWCSLGDVTGEWVSVTFLTPKTISRFRLLQADDGGSSSKATSYVIEYSTNAIDWSIAHTEPATAPLDKTADFSPKTARYWRARALSGGANAWIIYTLSLYSSDVNAWFACKLVIS